MHLCYSARFVRYFRSPPFFSCFSNLSILINALIAKTKPIIPNTKPTVSTSHLLRSIQ